MEGLECQAEIFRFYHLGGEEVMLSDFGMEVTYVSDFVFFLGKSF